MLDFRPASVSRLFFALLMAGAMAGVSASELGEAVVRSHIGQHLVADIELTGMSDPNVPVLVRLASADVYRGANIAMSPVLGSLNLSVMRRDGRQFLHVVSTAPVHAEHLNLFLDLNDGARRHVRAVTLWLTPDPQPARPAVPVAASPVSKPAGPVAAKALVPATLPTPAPAPAPTAGPTLPRSAPPAPAACPKATQEELRTCAALDYKNGMLQARIVELEAKVKMLKLAVDGGAAPVAVARKASPARVGKPAPAADSSGFPWLPAAAGAGGLALLGALGIYLRRKKAALRGAPLSPLKPALLARLTARWKRKKGAESTPASAVSPAAE